MPSWRATCCVNGRLTRYRWLTHRLSDGGSLRAALTPHARDQVTLPKIARASGARLGAMAQTGCQILVRKVCPNSVLTARGTEGSNLLSSSGEVTRTFARTNTTTSFRLAALKISMPRPGCGRCPQHRPGESAANSTPQLRRRIDPDNRDQRPGEKAGTRREPAGAAIVQR